VPLASPTIEEDPAACSKAGILPKDRQGTYSGGVNNERHERFEVIGCEKERGCMGTECPNSNFNQ
jgi:hypothetical protein